MGIALLCFTASLFSPPLKGIELNYAPRFYGLGDPGATEAMMTANQADFQVDYDHDDRLDLKIGEVSGGSRKPVTFSFDELVHFWKTQAKGKFVCVTLCKNTWSDAEVKEKVTHLTEYLFSCGVARVRVHQGLGTGVGVLADTVNHPAEKAK